MNTGSAILSLQINLSNFSDKKYFIKNMFEPIKNSKENTKKVDVSITGIFSNVGVLQFQ
jgi:hypothetical protein